jgi:hypothetical protein
MRKHKLRVKFIQHDDGLWEVRVPFLFFFWRSLRAERIHKTTDKRQFFIDLEVAVEAAQEYYSNKGVKL